MAGVWNARVDVYRHLVYQLGAGGVGCVSVLADDHAVKGENKMCQCRGGSDCVGDDIVDVDGLSNKFHSDG